jgi:hypothetical protein
MSDKPVIEIDRATWGFGKRVGDKNSRLLTESGFRCCLGFAMSQLGAPDKELLNIGSPYDVTLSSLDPAAHFAARMFLTETGWNSRWAVDAMHVNDAPHNMIGMRTTFHSTTSQEAAIVALGERPDAPVRFKFVGEYPPGVEVK